MTPADKERLLRVIDQAFADPYPPELENRPGRIAWGHEHVKEMIGKEFGENASRPEESHGSRNDLD